ncbi:SAF domain-containing protein [Corynebacterium sp. 335C]
MTDRGTARGSAPGPAWARRLRGARGGLLARRALAAGLAGLAVLLLAADVLGAGDGTRPVVVAARPVAAGAVLADADVRVARMPADLVPDGARATAAEVQGATAAGPIGAGEPVTAARLVGPELAEKLAGGPGARVVAVAPQDAGLTAVLSIGDVVEVIAPGGAADAAPSTIAAGARVLTAAEDGVVLLALPADSAARVAAVSLDSPLTLVLAGHGGEGARQNH